MTNFDNTDLELFARNPESIIPLTTFFAQGGSISDGVEHKNLLKENADYLAAHKQAGFPQIGTDAWINATWTLAEGFGNLNEMERLLARQNRSEFIRYAANSRTAIIEMRNRFGENDGPGNDRNRANAYQHSLWNALLTIAMGRERAKVWTDAHEFGTNGIATQMDFFNNEVGRRLADENRDQWFRMDDFIFEQINLGRMVYVCNRNGNQILIFTHENC